MLCLTTTGEGVKLSYTEFMSGYKRKTSSRGDYDYFNRLSGVKLLMTTYLKKRRNYKTFGLF